ncbi:MAG: N-(5'-phosphoribosyl)anthranilate isomerase [Acidimicrobiia bacterium]|nr:MAG: N-(5'-phosphoribosyl)anthranilate isomerase [Acidimicrobiia bacterium]
MIWVKVCGLSEERDVAAAVEAGTDAVGFVLAEGSPRRVSIHRAASLMDGVPALRILVTSNMEPGEIAAAVATTGADGIQAHGRHAAPAAAAGVATGWFVLRPVAMSTEPPEPDPATVPRGQIPLLDSAGATSLGGSGVPFDWETTGAIDRPFVLAGGLSPDNIRTAIDQVGPWGVDASSGLESAPGVKDPVRVAAFIEEAKRA